jgi:phospholipase/lecithinase/hemolysin
MAKQVKSIYKIFMANPAIVSNTINEIKYHFKISTFINYTIINNTSIYIITQHFILNSIFHTLHL